MIAVFDTNVFGIANWLEAVIPDMISQGSGLIAGVSSLASFRGMPNSGPYSASKAGLIHLTKRLALRLVGEGIVVGQDGATFARDCSETARGPQSGSGGEASRSPVRWCA